MVTKDSNKQRKNAENAPLHVLRKKVSGHLSKELRQKYTTRALPIRTGDVVKIIRGKFAKKEGKVTEVDSKNSYIYVEGIQLIKKDGKTVPLKVEPSNVVVVELYKDDEKRFKHIKVK